MIIEKSINDNVLKINRIRYKIIVLNIIFYAKIINIINDYAPQVGLDMGSKLKFYNDLKELIQKISIEKKLFEEI